MKLFTLRELLRLSRPDLFALHAAVVCELDQTAEDSVERFTALTNLRLIRYVLSRQDCVATIRRSFGVSPEPP